MFEAILIAGPTASGKSAAALALAKRFGGAVVNADSMQVYRELDVVTARPSVSDMAVVSHHLYGTVPASTPYSAGQWANDVAQVLAYLRSQGQVPVFVGGTGLYFMTLLKGLSPVPDIPEEVRLHWRARAEAGEDLHQILKKRDPAMAARLPPTDPQRLVRALEVIDATGLSLAGWQQTAGTPILDSDNTDSEKVLKIVVAPERDRVCEAIDTRFDAMIEAGALAEVEALAALKLDPGLPAMRALGIPELMAYLAGEVGLAEAVGRAKTVSRRYAKRQMTWARRFMADWSWFESADAAIASAAGGASPPTR